MKVHFHSTQFQMTQPLAEPVWSPKVPRWYQLDGAAHVVIQLLVEANFQFDSLILASPQSCNQTDFDFARNEGRKAQKFVHTLPNIRASMALQALDRVCPVYCLLSGSDTLEVALEEWVAQRAEGRRPALVVVDPVTDENQYTAWVMAAGPDTKAEVKKTL